MKAWFTSPSFYLLSQIIFFFLGWIPLGFTFSLLSGETSLENSLIALLCGGFIGLELYFLQRIYLFFQEKKSFLWIKIPVRLKILWGLGALPLFISGFLWINSAPIGFTYTASPLDQWISFWLFLSYYFVWFYPFFFFLQLYFSYEALRENKEMKSIAIAYIMTYISWVQSGALLIDLAWRGN